MSKPNRKKEQLKQRLLKAAKVRDKRLGLASQAAMLVQQRYSEAVDTWENGDRREAMQQLQALDREFPRREDVLRALTAWSHELGDSTGQLFYCRKLVEVVPDDAEVWYYLGESHLKCRQPVLARRAFQTAVLRWPNHEFAEGGRRMLTGIEKLLPSAVTYVPDLSEAERWKLAESHERIMVDLHAGRFEQVVEAAPRLWAKWPTFIPARNNAAEAQFHLGRLQDAIAIARETVQLFPDNTYALASLIRFLTLGGQEEEGLHLVERLRDMPPHNSDHLLCSLETFALLGLDAMLLDVWRQAEPEAFFVNPHDEAMCLHLAAVAASHLGQHGPARQNWERALEVFPTLSVAAENLEDLDRPEAERHGAWSMGISFWVDRAIVERISKIAHSSHKQDECRRQLQQLLLDRPTLMPLCKLMLKRGDPLACNFVFSIAKDLVDSPLVEPLRQFVGGQHGSQKLRTKVLFWLQQKGLLDGDVQRMWIKGEWHEIRLQQMEIYREPESSHAPEVADLASRAFELINHDKQPQEGERLLRAAIALEPNAPDLLNNLAAALLGQGRNDESYAIVREVQRRFPDYFFGRIALAHEQIAEDDLEAAKKTLGELTQRKRFHISEYAAMGECYIRIAAEMDDVDQARAWLQRIEDVYPDYHALGKLRRVVALLGGKKAFSEFTKKQRLVGGNLTRKRKRD